MCWDRFRSRKDSALTPKPCHRCAPRGFDRCPDRMEALRRPSVGRLSVMKLDLASSLPRRWSRAPSSARYLTLPLGTGRRSRRQVRLSVGATMLTDSRSDHVRDPHVLTVSHTRVGVTSVPGGDLRQELEHLVIHPDDPQARCSKIATGECLVHRCNVYFSTHSSSRRTSFSR